MPEELKADNGEHLGRLRRICLSLPGASEKLSHGEPTFFVNKKVFAMFSNNHHADGHVGVWLPVAPGAQATLIATSPAKFYRPPYVGVRGWVGVELKQVDDEELGYYLTDAWRLIGGNKIGNKKVGEKKMSDKKTAPRRR